MTDERRTTVVYCRVSTADQAENGVSLDAQRDRCTMLAASQDATVDHVYVDAGESAKSLHRPALTDLLNDVRAGAVKAVYIYSLSRLARNTGDMLELVKLFEHHQVRLVSTAEMLDTRTAAGRLLLTILAAVATWEREVIVERTVEALAAKRRRGERTGTIPYGLMEGPGGNLIVNAHEQEIMKRAQGWRAQGWALSAIATRLNEQGFRTRGGGKYDHSLVSRVLLRGDR